MYFILFYLIYFIIYYSIFRSKCIKKGVYRFGLYFDGFGLRRGVYRLGLQCICFVFFWGKWFIKSFCLNGEILEFYFDLKNYDYIIGYKV